MSSPDMPSEELAKLLGGDPDPVIDRTRAVLGLSADDPVLAVAWGTVDAERVLAQLGRTDGRPVEDEALGGAGVILQRGAALDVLLEPSTEGRLAACLARNGEGICALYVSVEDVTTVGLRRTAIGQPGRLRRSGPRNGPFIIEIGGA